MANASHAPFDPTELSPASEWREISDGGYSEVYKAHLLGTAVAVKQVRGATAARA